MDVEGSRTVYDCGTSPVHSDRPGVFRDKVSSRRKDLVDVWSHHWLKIKEDFSTDVSIPLPYIYTCVCTHVRTHAQLSSLVPVRSLVLNSYE